MRRGIWKSVVYAWRQVRGIHSVVRTKACSLPSFQMSCTRVSYSLQNGALHPRIISVHSLTPDIPYLATDSRLSEMSNSSTNTQRTHLLHTILLYTHISPLPRPVHRLECLVHPALHPRITNLNPDLPRDRRIPRIHRLLRLIRHPTIKDRLTCPRLPAPAASPTPSSTALPHPPSPPPQPSTLRPRATPGARSARYPSPAPRSPSRSCRRVSAP
jgi:hypothetical protein